MLIQNQTPQVEPTTVPSDGVSLRSVFSAYRGQILFTYLLFVVENLLRLAQPLVIGIAINDLFASSFRGLLLFLGQHTLHLAIGTARQMYDTRVFTRIHSDAAGRFPHGGIDADDSGHRISQNRQNAVEREGDDRREKSDAGWSRPPNGLEGTSQGPE